MAPLLLLHVAEIVYPVTVGAGTAETVTEVLVMQAPASPVLTVYVPGRVR
ncbi:MAG: hypothetical protein IPP46_13335 [Bacteroidetes bacterium]|nr:hypothetical protein [Bacteroidota bacterium]